MKVKYIRSNEIQDIFSYLDKQGEEQYISFPRTMEMGEQDVKEHIENSKWYE